MTMAAVFPLSLMAEDTGAAILRSSGMGVLVNSSAAPSSIAVFSNDLIETQRSAVARIETPGSTADINPETTVQYQSDELVLDHGSVSVNTTRGMTVRVGCVTITPVNPAGWTQYQVVDLDGKITVVALKLDVYIDARLKNFEETKKSSQASPDLVRESEQKSRSEKCGAAYIKPERPGIVSILNSTYAKWSALAAVGVITCFGLCHDDDPVSRWKP
jgi:hypothetical protein